MHEILLKAFENMHVRNWTRIVILMKFNIIPQKSTNTGSFTAFIR